MKLQLLEKKDLVEPEIDIRYSSMTQPLNRIVQYIRQQEYLIQGIFEKKLYQIPLNEVLYFETVDKKTKSVFRISCYNIAYRCIQNNKCKHHRKCRKICP